MFSIEISYDILIVIFEYTYIYNAFCVEWIHVHMQYLNYWLSSHNAFVCTYMYVGR